MIELIKTIRKSMGITQKEFSELFDPPIPLDTIKNWECGRKSPPDWVAGLIIEKLENLKTADL